MLPRFASRQDQSNPENWLGSQCPCPTCRSKFCVRDVRLIQWDGSVGASVTRTHCDWTLLLSFNNKVAVLTKLGSDYQLRIVSSGVQSGEYQWSVDTSVSVVTLLCSADTDSSSVDTSHSQLTLHCSDDEILLILWFQSSFSNQSWPSVSCLK